ncbi:MAG TPA: type I-E CRISPR-associated protein Cse2/CasB [Oscillospiraceae bacterium]|nr:type I-E CRISPR-associated protein Cse2/CasB [Oscillospiraceae bacterium]
MSQAQVSSYVLRKVNMMLETRERGVTKAMLANLRRGIGKVPGELPELWGEFLQDIPEEFLSRNGEPTKEEWAIYIALTMFALHQQGREMPMHQQGASLGRAVRKLEKDKDDRERVLRRFGPIVTATDMQGLSYHLRNMIQLLRSEGISLDYGMLANDLFWFQFAEQQNKVKLTWGEEYYKQNREEE